VRKRTDKVADGDTRMNAAHRTRPIIIVTDARGQESRLRGLERERTTENDVRTVPASADLESAMERRDDEPASITPSAVVIELDCPGEIETVLRRVHASLAGVPTVVVPRERAPNDSPRSRSGPTRPSTCRRRDEDPIDRIVSTVRSSTSVPADGSDDRYHHILANELPDEAFVIGENGTYLEAKVRSESADLYSMPADDLVGTTLDDAFPDAVAAKLQECVDRAIRTDDVQSVEYEADTTDGRRQFEARVVPIDERVQGRHAVVWLARDITERVERERQLRSRQDQLETLNRINAVVRRVIETLVEAPARRHRTREVCEQLVDSELYCGSWIAERTGDGRLSYRTGAGEAETVLERIREYPGDDHDNPVAKAAQTGELRTTNRILEDESIPDELRAAAREDDVRSAIAVPITHEDATYGVLTVLASRDDAFSERERAGFRLLGETIGFTIMAVKNRQLLFADSVVELEFESTAATRSRLTSRRSTAVLARSSGPARPPADARSST